MKCSKTESESPVSNKRLAERLNEDRYDNPSKYSVVLVSEGAMFEGGDMVFKNSEKERSEKDYYNNT
jgi:hypothetical protein